MRRAALIAILVSSFSASAQTLYTTLNFNQVVSYDVSGAVPGPATIIHDYGATDFAGFVAFDGKNNRIYVGAQPASGGLDRIDRVDTDGNNYTFLVTMATNIFLTSLAYNPTEDLIYYSTQNGITGEQQILRADANNGSSPEALFTAGNGLTIRSLAIDVAGQVIHWSQNMFIPAPPDGQLLSAPIPAPGMTLTASTNRTGLTPTIGAIDLTYSPLAEETYWAGDGIVRKAATDGTGGIIDLATSGTTGITVDRGNERVYWTRNNELHVADLYGTNPSTFAITNIGQYVAISNADLPVELKAFAVD